MGQFYPKENGKLAKSLSFMLFVDTLEPPTQKSRGEGTTEEILYASSSASSYPSPSQFAAESSKLETGPLNTVLDVLGLPPLENNVTPEIQPSNK
ncbi:hypothetical protein ACTXT7_011956 [Hymenolepis weldensis]